MKREKIFSRGKKNSRLALWLLPLLLVTIIGAGIFATSIDAKAAKKSGGLITGDLPDKPIAENAGILKFEDIDDSSLLEDVTPVEKDVPLDTGEHYKYLSNTGKKVYEAVYKSVVSGRYIPYAQSYTLPTKYSNDATFKKYAYIHTVGSTAIMFSQQDVTQAMEAVYYDHPDRIEFYMCTPALYGAYQDKSGKYYSWILVKSNYNEALYASYDAQIASAANALVSGSGASAYANNAKKEIVMHDYFAPRVTYDMACFENGNNGYYDVAHTAYGSLVSGKAVCDGYSAGFKILMNKLGVDAMVITGDGAGGGSWGGHAWSIVNLDGNWYEVDTTWDSNIYEQLGAGADYNSWHTYFNKTTTEFATDHRRTANTYYLGFKLPAAAGTFFTLQRCLAADPGHDTIINVTGVTVTPTSKNLVVDESVALDINVYPVNAANRKYTVTSSNPAVAYVSGDAVTGVAPGSAVITVTTADGAFHAACVVNVSVPVGTEGVDSTGITYRVTSQTTASIVKVNTSASTITIPAMVNIQGAVLKVTSVEKNVFKKNKKIKKVEGGANLTTINAGAFYGCKKLTSLKLTSSGIKTIGKQAFCNCSKLKTIEINGSSLKSVKKDAFKGISSKAKISIKASKKKFGKIVNLFKKAGANVTFKRK